MDIGLITLLLFLGLIGLLALGLPIGISTGLLALVTTLFSFGPDALSLLTSRTYTFATSYVLVAIPLFILMATTLDRAGVGADLFKFLRLLAGGVPGGLAVQTALAAVVIGAMTGIIGGEVTLLGLVALPHMLAQGYDRKLAIGTICAGGSLGTMIPPSLVLVAYGLVTETSIGALFFASFIPGLLLAALYIAYILARCGLDPSMGPPAPREERDIPLRQKLQMTHTLILPVFVVFCVMGTIYAGIASISEAAALGALGAFVSAAVRGAFSFEMLSDVLSETINTVGKILWLVFGANMLVGIYILIGGDDFVRSSIEGLEVPPIVVILLMQLIIIVLGGFMDFWGISFLTMPLFFRSRWTWASTRSGSGCSSR